MKIIYHCYGGAHSSVTAANIHLGVLPVNRIPEPGEIKEQKFFDRNKMKDSGKIFFMGRDKWGNDVYVVGRRSRPSLLCKVTLLSEMFEIDAESFMLVNMSEYVNLTMKIGGYISRRLGLAWIGRPLVTRGTIKSYSGIVNMVDKVCKKIGQRNIKAVAQEPNLESPGPGSRIIICSCYFPLISLASAIDLKKPPLQYEVAVISTISGRFMLRNMINTFLKLNDIKKNEYIIMELSLWGGILLGLGQLLSHVPFTRKAGTALIDNFMKKIHTQLVNAVKLDCNCQISDN
ncbi:MAG: DUF3189 family protein [Desulfocucumaceae bacterium]